MVDIGENHSRWTSLMGYSRWYPTFHRGYFFPRKRWANYKIRLTKLFGILRADDRKQTKQKQKQKTKTKHGMPERFFEKKKTTTTTWNSNTLHRFIGLMGNKKKIFKFQDISDKKV